MNIVYFDLETQKSAEEVGGWRNKHLMKVSFGVTYSSMSNTFRGYEERDIGALLSELSSADRVIGYNIVGFDYPVLSGYTDFDFSRIPTLDLMASLESKLGFRLKLDSLAKATLQSGKSGDGLQAIRWFREGNFANIALYCQEDVRITRDLHLFGCKYRYVYYTDKMQRLVQVKVDW